MYSRRLKMNKKKSTKPSRTSKPGSNWGPRLAIIERERAVASGAILDEDDEELYEIHHEVVQGVHKKMSSGGSPATVAGALAAGAGGGGGARSSSSSTSTAVDPVLRLGRSSSPNYFYYNYSRRAPPNAAASTGSGAGQQVAQQQRKVSCPEPSSQQYQKSKQQSHYQHHRRASYVLGSSSGYCSGSVTTLSTCANPNEQNNGGSPKGSSNLTKPLTLIIPPHDGHNYHGGGGGHHPHQYQFGALKEYNGKNGGFDNGHGILMKQRSRDKSSGQRHHLPSHDHRHQNDPDEFVTTEDQSPDDNSFQSSSTYQSSGDDDEQVGGEMGGSAEMVVHSSRLFHNPMAHMNRKKREGDGGEGGNGIFQVLTKKEVVQVHAVPAIMDDLGTGTEPETLEMTAEEECGEGEGGGNGDKVGSTLAALHKGITMVYVPMKDKGEGAQTVEEDEGDNSSTEDIPELGHPHQQLSDNECSASTSSSGYRGGGAASKEPEDSLVSSNFILKKKQDVLVTVGHGGVMDSLLDSFDSILFKPKPGEKYHKAQEKCYQVLPLSGGLAQGEAQHKGIRKRPEQPPPLPPPGGEQNGGQQMKQKSLRFALENLETVLNPSSLKTPSPSCSSGSEECHRQQQPHAQPPPPPKKVLKKVTLSLPGEDAISSRNHELLLNYEELNTCSTEILSCGHVRNDDYSTISSMTSSAQEISDLEEIINGCSGSGHSAHEDGGSGREGRRSNSVSSTSGGDSDASGGGQGISKKESLQRQQIQREPRSVLQQLRDLSRLIRGSSPTKPPPVTQVKKETKEVSNESSNKNSSFYLHNDANNTANGGNNANNNNTSGDSEIAKRKTSDATDNSADSGKGSGSGTSASGSSGQEGSSGSSAEPSPNNTRGGVPGNAVGVGASNKGKNTSAAPGGPILKTTKILQQSSGRRLKIATIRGRGGGAGRHYCPTDEDNGSPPEHLDGDSCSQRSSVCSCQDCCDYRSDCNECVLYSKPPNSKELCNSGDVGSSNNNQPRIKLKQQTHPTQHLMPPPPPPPSQQRAPKSSISKVLVRRTSSRIRAAAARRTASLRRQRQQRDMMITAGGGQRKPVILDYCDCSNCDMQGCGDHYGEGDEDDEDFYEVDYEDEMEDSRCTGKNCKRPSPPRYPQPPPESLLIPINQPSSQSSKKSGGNAKCKSRAPDPRKISTSSGVSSSSASSRNGGIYQQQPQQMQGSQLFRNSDVGLQVAAMTNNASAPVMPPSGGMGPCTSASSSGNLFTIDEANEESVYGESTAVTNGGGGSSGGAVILGKGRNPPKPSVPGGGSPSSSGGSSGSKSGPRVDFQLLDDDLDSDDRRPRVSMINGNSNNNRRMSSHSQHSHPKCWLAPDATLGWSDLESLYSQNMKVDFNGSSSSEGNKRSKRGGGSSSKKGHPLPAALRDECPTCWKELSEMKKNCPDPNRTVDRTKRMFIWLNRRHKEFHAPWWEAKKQASMRWLVTKSFAHAVPKDKIPDPFKESKKGKPTKYSLRDEIVKGLVSGRLYCMALDSLYRSQQNNYHLNQNLTHWEIIKILSRRGIYIAQPSDMKLTETTLRQKKPIRTAAHIALIEAMMGLYAKEILGRDRIAATLRSFGRCIDPDTNSPERLVISWINTAVTTLKSYILSKAPQQLPPNKVNRWLNLPDVGEIRDLCDGVGVCALFALYCSNDMKIDEISVPEPGDTLTIYDSITNHSLVQKLCDDLFPEPIYHLCVTDFLYIHGCMKQNILCFLVDLFVHLEINPILRVNRLTHVPIRVEL